MSEELAELVTLAEGNQAEAKPRQLVHGDFWDSNVLFRDDRIVLVTDLDFMGERPRVDDLALTLYFADSTFGYEHDRTRVARLARLVDLYDSGLDHPLTTAGGPPCRWRSRASRCGRSEAGSPRWTTRGRPATSLPSCRPMWSVHCN